jgi:hypothetical protein
MCPVPVSPRGGKFRRREYDPDVQYFRAAIIILVTAAIGGAIAFLGNNLGRYVGRKKLSVFKLRPRYTSMLITILTGMMIAGATLGLAMIVSQPVRITLLNPDEYRKTVENLESKLQKLASLEQAYPVYKFQDTILSVVINPEPDVVKMRAALKEVIYNANKAAIAKSQRVAKDKGEEFNFPVGGKLVGYIPDNFEMIARELSRLQGEQVIFARSFKNATIGDQFPVELGKPIPNKLIFNQGELIMEGVIDGHQNYYAVYDELLRLIRTNISQVAIYKGLFPNPDDGSVGEFNADKLKKLAMELKQRNRKTKVAFFAGKDTHILGPLQVEFEIRE